MQKHKLNNWDIWLVTWFGAGLSPKAPGTMGSLAGLPFAVGIFYFAGWQGLLLAAILVTILGVMCSHHYMQRIGKTEDPQEIVIDEVAGLWIALLPMPLDVPHYMLAFLLFRLFDITKPSFIGWIDREVKGANGVMFDDVAAGIVAAIIGYVVTIYY